MSQVSRQIINPRIQERILDLFLSGIVFCNSREKASLLIEDLLTPTERVVLSKRFSIAFMLLKGYDYLSIKEALKVSPSTIGHVALWLKTKGQGVKKVIETIQKNEKTNETLENIGNAIEDFLALSPGRNWKETRRNLYRERLNRRKEF